MIIDFGELDVSFFWDHAFAAADANWRRLSTSERANTIVQLLLEREAKAVLDLGCAIGRLSMLIAAQGIEVYGLDASEKAITFARSWALDEKMPNVHFDVGIASTLTYPSQSFDAVIANALLDHMPMVETQKALKEIWAVLKPGGCCFASFDGLSGKEDQPHHVLNDGTRLYVHGMRRGLIWRYYAEEEIRQLFKGFRIDEFYQDDDGSRVIVGTKPARPPQAGHPAERH